MKTDYVCQSADGLQLYCAVYAAQQPGGLPVLCLPGLTRNSRDFTALASRLCEQHEVLTPDLRGRGRSAWDSDPCRYQAATYVQDMWTLMSSRRVPRVLVIGTSLGALMALVMAATKPERIAGVVLNDAGPELDPAGLQRIAAYVGKLPPVRTWNEAASQAESIYHLALPGLGKSEWLDFARRGYREDTRGFPIPDMDPSISDAFRNPPAAIPDLWSVYAQIEGVPMLVIRGALSDVLSAATLARMAREKPDLQYITVENRGHAPLLNEPQCLKAIDTFVARFGHEAS
jgi:pimeloyl-ACP methyl ester carboxylesterase